MVVERRPGEANAWSKVGFVVTYAGIRFRAGPEVKVDDIRFQIEISHRAADRRKNVIAQAEIERELAAYPEIILDELSKFIETGVVFVGQPILFPIVRYAEQEIGKRVSAGVGVSSRQVLGEVGREGELSESRLRLIEVALVTPEIRLPA